MEHKNIYTIYKNIINSVNNNNDLEYFMNDITNQRTKSIIESMSYIIKNKTTIGMIDFLKLIETLSMEKYKEDIYLLLENKNIDCIVQKNTIERIIKNKPNRKIDFSNSHLKIVNTEEKNCPHCGHKNESYKDNTYIICGYSNNIGYDWDGCGRDWCFFCGKKLCKKWDEHELYMISNRYHNHKCCLKYAFNESLDYANDFCMCSNIFVNRKNDSKQ